MAELRLIYFRLGIGLLMRLMEIARTTSAQCMAYTYNYY